MTQETNDGPTDGDLCPGGFTYVLPIRCEWAASSMEDLTEYLRCIGRRAELIVVDGSDPDVFAANRRLWSAFARHVPPHPHDRCLNGKAWGVKTGVRYAWNDRIVVADDDVRYRAAELAAIVSALDEGDVVRPQNYFSPLPWHAAWDTARSLINRAVGHDHPGTLGMRRSAYERAGGYDGDVLFENLELVRTIKRTGGTVVDRPDLFVRRLPPTSSRFWSQRVRQAYDDFAEPGRISFFLAIGPALVAATARFGARVAVAAIVGSIVVAESGRRRASGRDVFSFRASLCAPLWVLERAVCSWVAVAARLRGGVRYAGQRIRRAAGPISGPAPVPPVAQRGEAGTATPAQGHDVSAALDLQSVVANQEERPPNEQGPIRADPNDRFLEPVVVHRTHDLRHRPDSVPAEEPVHSRKRGPS